MVDFSSLGLLNGLGNMYPFMQNNALPPNLSPQSISAMGGNIPSPATPQMQPQNNNAAPQSISPDMLARLKAAMSVQQLLGQPNSSTSPNSPMSPMPQGMMHGGMGGQGQLQQLINSSQPSQQNPMNQQMQPQQGQAQGIPQLPMRMPAIPQSPQMPTNAQSGLAQLQQNPIQMLLQRRNFLGAGY